MRLMIYMQYKYYDFKEQTTKHVFNETENIKINIIIIKNRFPLNNYS